MTSRYWSLHSRFLDSVISSQRLIMMRNLLYSVQVWKIIRFGNIGVLTTAEQTARTASVAHSAFQIRPTPMHQSILERIPVLDGATGIGVNIIASLFDKASHVPLTAIAANPISVTQHSLLELIAF